MQGAWSAHQLLVDKATTRRPAPASWGALIAWLAERQHGVVASWQLVAVGIPRQSISNRVRSGQLHSIDRGLYAVGHRRLSERGRWSAAALAGGRRAALARDAAAALWGLIDFSPGRIDVVAPTKRTRPEHVRFHRGRLPADELTSRDGIPVTTAARTIFDLAATVTEGRLERMLDLAERARLGGPLSLPDLLARYPGRPGAPSLRRVLDQRGALSILRSDLEQLFLALLRDRGLELPRTNAPIRVAGQAYELDCYWPRHGLAVELDSYRHHAGRRSFREDRLRDRRLRAIGVETVRVSHQDVTAGAAELEADLLRIRPGLGRGGD